MFFAFIVDTASTILGIKYILLQNFHDEKSEWAGLSLLLSARSCLVAYRARSWNAVRIRRDLVGVLRTLHKALQSLHLCVSTEERLSRGTCCAAAGLWYKGKEWS